jgi:hypothetical protein
VGVLAAWQVSCRPAYYGKVAHLASVSILKRANRGTQVIRNVARSGLIDEWR